MAAAAAAAAAAAGMAVDEERLVKYAEAVELNLENKNPQEILKILYDSDLRRFGSGSLPETVNKMDGEIVQGPMVVQVTKCVNVSEPSHYQHAPSRNMYLIDGAREGRKMSACCDIRRLICACPLNSPGVRPRNPPGNKIENQGCACEGWGMRNPACFEQVTGMQVLLLGSGCCSVLGGVVQSLKEEWETSKVKSNVEDVHGQPNLNTEIRKLGPKDDDTGCSEESAECRF
eukprot:207099-Hanusia_phi.AAC.3